MNKLKNKNLAELYEVFEGDVSYYMVMEYLDIELVDYLKSQIDPKDIKIIL
jgi:calcium-dependent protein kinase